MAPSENGQAPVRRRPAAADSAQRAGAPGGHNWGKPIHEAVASATHQVAMSSFGPSRDIWRSSVAKLPGVVSNSGMKQRKPLPTDGLIGWKFRASP